ncbi:MAG: YqaE/Pmp3 family membrane protein [Myxococcota bacterium]
MSTFVSLLLAGLLPPVGVLMKKGVGAPLIINTVLCLLFWIPGMLHAVWVITNDD